MKTVITDPSLVPPEGFVYRDPNTGMRFDGKSLTETVKLVVEHRKANGLPRQTAEEVDEDVQCQICHRVPRQFCKGTDHPDWELSGGSIINAAKALGKMMAEGLGGGTPFVEQEEADRRASICAKCFHNRDLAGCGIGCQIKEKMREVFGATIGQRATPSDPRLFGCEVCGCHCKTIVWFKKDILNGGLDPQRIEEFKLTPNCWRV